VGILTAPAPILGSTEWEGCDDCLAPDEENPCATDPDCDEDSGGGGGGGGTTDALLAPLPVAADHFSAGRAQSIGGGDEDWSPFGRYLTAFAVEYLETGGPDGGGCVEITDDDSMSFLDIPGLLITPPLPSGESHPAGPPYDTLEGPGETPPPQQANLLSWHHLRGVTIDGPKDLQQFRPHLRIQVMPDYTLRAISKRIGVGDGWVVIATSTATVPADDHFLLDTKASFHPWNYTRGGFVQTNLHTPDRSVLGTAALRGIGVRTRDTTPLESAAITGFKITGPIGSRIGGWIYANASGDARRHLAETYIGAARPTADGDVIESEVEYTRIEEVPGQGNVQPLGTTHRWGSDDRWRNAATSDQDASAHLVGDWGMGNISSFTGNWDPGQPTYPTNPDPFTRNTLRDEAMDQLRVLLGRSAVSVEGVAPFALTGVRDLGGSWSAFPGFGGRLPWMFTGPHPNGDHEYPHGMAHTSFRLGVKSAGGLLTMGRPGRAVYDSIIEGVSQWRTLPNYMLAPYTMFARDPETGGLWLPDGLPQFVIRGEFRDLDGIEGLDPEDRWVKLDYTNAGLDVLYHKREVPDLASEPIAPIAAFDTDDDTDEAIGNVVVFENSVDFNGTIDDLISGITSRLMDWGDGSEPEALDAGALNAHHYLHGTYTATLTVTNAAGLTSTFSREYVIGVNEPVADFTGTADEDDETGLTVDFTDLSENITGTITGWAWDFDDLGATASTQNPTHVFSAEGDYNVMLTVTDDLGQQDVTVHTIHVEAPTPPYVEPGTGQTMPVDFSHDFASGSAGVVAAFDWVNASPKTDVYNAAGGIEGTGCGEEHDPGGPDWPAYWQKDASGAQLTAHKFDLYAVGRFNLNGKTVVANTPLFQGYPTKFALVVTPAGKVRFYVDSYPSAGMTLLGESVKVLVGDEIPLSGYCRIDVRGRSSNTSGGLAWVRFSNNPAVKGDLVEFAPDGGGPTVRQFTGLNFYRTAASPAGSLISSIAMGTGSSNGDWGFGTWPGVMIDGVQWDNVFHFNPVGFGDFDWADNA
jgi:PKD repeat protein